jgi:1-pyrroline-5-carboxylate dehydrogenase
MGNTVVWKPSPTQQLAASLTMELLEEAGMPPGVINMLPGDGLDVSKVALTHPDLAGIHFTGSTPTFQHLWQTIGTNIASYRAYPRIVGETGGKDFIVAHPSADPDVLRVAMLRGAFEFQGQKCSAASRAYVARSVWDKVQDQFLHDVDGLTMGDVTDFSNFMGAVIDDRAFAKHKKAIARVRANKHLTLLAGGQTDDSVGYFVRPTIVQSTDPTDQMFSEEYFGPILAVHVYEDDRFEKVVAQMESFAPYALAGDPASPHLRSTRSRICCLGAASRTCGSGSRSNLATARSGRRGAFRRSFASLARCRRSTPSTRDTAVRCLLVGTGDPRR